MNSQRLDASFRDPSGFLFHHEGRLLRQVNAGYAEHLARLHDSGLYAHLVDKGLLVAHREVSLELARTAEAVAVLEPEHLPFISYPYEWSFTQLKDAALATLRIQKLAMARGMILKDASAYNIQFHQGRPVFIDTLSFETYVEGRPWVAYRQFCQHFLAPLALMAFKDVRLGQMLRTHLDGIPLDLASALLPFRTRIRPGLLMHLHAHARSQKKHAASGEKDRAATVSAHALAGIVDSLRGTVTRLQWSPPDTEWGDYYQDTNYSDSALDRKKELVGGFLDRTESKVVWDLGANDGTFSRLASGRGILTIASDVDPVAVEKNWLQCRKGKAPNLLPLLMDLTNASPGLGWGHRERTSLSDRGPADTVLALALIHHLAISNNVPLDMLANFLATVGRHLIIEFVPKSDSQVRRLLTTREDVFPAYHRQGFETAFSPHFETLDQVDIQGTERTLYLMRARR